MVSLLQKATHKIKNSVFIEQNVFTSFGPSLCSFPSPPTTVDFLLVLGHSNMHGYVTF